MTSLWPSCLQFLHSVGLQQVSSSQPGQAPQVTTVSQLSKWDGGTGRPAATPPPREAGGPWVGRVWCRGRREASSHRHLSGGCTRFSIFPSPPLPPCPSAPCPRLPFPRFPLLVRRALMRDFFRCPHGAGVPGKASHSAARCRRLPTASCLRSPARPTSDARASTSPTRADCPGPHADVAGRERGGRSGIRVDGPARLLGR